MTDARQRLASIVNGGRKDWYSIENKAAETATVRLYDEIGWFGVTPQDFARDLDAVTAQQIDLHIHSPGGSVFDGLAILNALRSHPARVVTTVDGIAASAASFIAMAGEEIVMAENSQMMIHDAGGLVIGNSKDMTAMAALLDKQSDNIAAIYAKRAGGDVAGWREAMRAETWYSADEAVAAGLADRVDDSAPGDVTNRFDLSIFNYAGRAKAPAPAALAAHSPPAEPAERNTPNPDQEVTVDDTDTLRAGLAQRLGVTDANPTDEVLLAALDESQAEAATVVNVTHVAPAAEVGGPDLLAEVGRLSSELAAVNAREAQREKTSFFDTAAGQGRISPAERPGYEAMYDAAPQATRDFILARAIGSAVPVAALGHDGGIETGGTADDDLYASLFGKQG